jgi:hypothetical protein
MFSCNYCLPAMKKLLFCLCLLTGLIFSVTAQQLVIRHQHKQKEIKLKPDLDLRFYTSKGFYKGQVIALTDTAFRLSRVYKSGRNTVYTFQVPVSKKYKDGIRTKKSAYYIRDTVNLLLKDILIIKKPWINKRGWLLIPAYLLGGAILAVPLLPVAAISNGGAGVRNWLQFEALLIGLSGPSIFIGTRNKKYVLGEKWMLVIK